MKNKKVIKGLVSILSVAMLTICLAGCGESSSYKDVEDDKRDTTELSREDFDKDAEADKVEEADQVEEADKVEESNADTHESAVDSEDSKEAESVKPSEDVPVAETEQDVIDINTLLVGNDKVGYVQVPANYVKLYEPSYGEDAVCYCDGTTFNIMCLVYYDVEGLTAMQAAQNLAAGIESEGGFTPESFLTSTVQLGGVEAYQICAYYPNSNQWLINWLFESPYDDYVHYASVEFVGQDLTLFNLMEQTYRFTE